MSKKTEVPKHDSQNRLTQPKVRSPMPEGGDP
jgi:hypothetical protein